MAAIVFSGKLTLDGWLPRLGTLTSITEDRGKCDAASSVELSLYGAGLLGALLIGMAALCECAALELAGGDTLRTIGSMAALRSEGASDLADGLDSIVGDETESAERTRAKSSEPGLFSLDFSSEGWEGVASSSSCKPGVPLEFATGGAGVREADSSS